MKQNQSSDLAEISANNRNRLIRNNLILVSVLNFATLLIFVIGMCVPQWFHLVIKDNQPAVWVNLLFVYNKPDYMKFHTAISLYCKNPRDSCMSIFQRLQFIGTFVFCIFIAGNLLQIYDLFRVLRRVLDHSPVTGSNKFRHFLTIGTFLLGIGVYVFSICVIEDIAESSFGVCFYIAISSLILLILTIIYERESMRQMSKQQMLIKLLENQKKIEQNTQEIQVNRFSGDSFVL